MSRRILGHRLRRTPRGIYGIQFLDKIDGTKATFVCKDGGHKSTRDYGKGPVSKRMPAAALQRFARYWGLRQADGKRHGHIYGYCRACAREHVAVGDVVDITLGVSVERGTVNRINEKAGTYEITVGRTLVQVTRKDFKVRGNR